VLLKNYIVENNLSTLDSYRFTLFYGENVGFKDIIKKKLKNANSNAEIFNFFQDEILKNETLLPEQINNTSLFSSNKLIFIHEASDKIFKQIEDSIESKNVDCKVIIFSSILDKKSKLRNHFEKEKNLAVIACYEDTERTLINYINFELRELQGLTPEITNLIINNSNMNRKIIGDELDKINTCFHKRRIELEELKNLLNIKSNTNFNLARDACLLGNKIKVNQLISEIDFLPEDNFYYLNQISNRIIKLIELNILMDSTKDKELALDTVKPKIFWKDKPIYLKQLDLWEKKSLELTLNKVSGIEILMKKNSHVRNDLLIKNLLIDICLAAAHQIN
tara:strand:+ start:155 stop:1162 length:1008 start_codon:yes stop_codon:yes gene_type:complete